MKARARVLSLVLMVALLLAVPQAVFAADKGIAVELNKLEGRKGACRVYMVFTNGQDSQLETFKPELVFFGKDGVIVSRLVVEGGPLTPGKTKVKLFDLGGSDCAGLGRVLLNDVVACRTATKDLPGCAGLVRPSSRAAIDFIK